MEQESQTNNIYVLFGFKVEYHADSGSDSQLRFHNGFIKLARDWAGPSSSMFWTIKLYEKLPCRGLEGKQSIKLDSHLTPGSGGDPFPSSVQTEIHQFPSARKQEKDWFHLDAIQTHRLPEMAIKDTQECYTGEK